MNEIAFSFIVFYSTLIIYNLIYLGKTHNKERIYTRLVILILGLSIALGDNYFQVNNILIQSMIVISLLIYEVATKDNHYAK